MWTWWSSWWKPAVYAGRRQRCWTCARLAPVILLANKIDKLQRRSDLAPWLPGDGPAPSLHRSSSRCRPTKDDVRRVFDILPLPAPKQDWWYDEDMLTDKSERFQTTEIIREARC